MVVFVAGFVPAAYLGFLFGTAVHIRIEVDRVEGNLELGLRAAIRHMTEGTTGPELPPRTPAEPDRFITVHAANGKFILVWPPLRWHFDSSSASTWGIDPANQCAASPCGWTAFVVFEQSLPGGRWPVVPPDATEVDWPNVTFDCERRSACGTDTHWTSQFEERVLDSQFP